VFAHDGASRRSHFLSGRKRCAIGLTLKRNQCTEYTGSQCQSVRRPWTFSYIFLSLNQTRLQAPAPSGISLHVSQYNAVDHPSPRLTLTPHWSASSRQPVPMPRDLRYPHRLLNPRLLRNRHINLATASTIDSPRRWLHCRSDRQAHPLSPVALSFGRLLVTNRVTF